LESLSEMAIASQTVGNAMHFQSCCFPWFGVCGCLHSLLFGLLLAFLRFIRCLLLAFGFFRCPCCLRPWLLSSSCTVAVFGLLRSWLFGTRQSANVIHAITANPFPWLVVDRRKTGRRLSTLLRFIRCLLLAFGFFRCPCCLRPSLSSSCTLAVFGLLRSWRFRT